MKEDQQGLETVYRWDGDPRLELVRRIVRWEDGTERRWHALFAQDGIPGVVVVAVRAASFLLVEHDRPWAGGEFLELPRGFGEPSDGERGSDSAAQVGAERELLEETGYRAASSKVLGRYSLDTGLVPGWVAVVQVTVDEMSPRGEIDGEIRDHRWVPESALPELVASGALRDGHSLAAAAMLLARGRPPT